MAHSLAAVALAPQLLATYSGAVEGALAAWQLAWLGATGTGESAHLSSIRMQEHSVMGEA